MRLVWQNEDLRKILEAVTGTDIFDPRELVQNVAKTASEHRPTKMNEISTPPEILRFVLLCFPLLV